MLEQLVELDHELFLYLNGLGSSVWDGFWLFYTNKKHWIPMYIVLLIVMYKQRGNKNFVWALIVIVAMVAFTDQVTNLFKHSVKRPRPCYQTNVMDNMRLVRDWCGGKYGYFSGHSSNSMAVAIFVGLTLLKRQKYLIFILVFWAFLMAYSRIYVGVHYPLDIISGMAFGAFSGFIFFKLEKYLQKRFVFNKKD